MLSLIAARSKKPRLFPIPLGRPPWQSSITSYRAPATTSCVGVSLLRIFERRALHTVGEESDSVLLSACSAQAPAAESFDVQNHSHRERLIQLLTKYKTLRSADKRTLIEQHFHGLDNQVPHWYNYRPRELEQELRERLQAQDALVEFIQKERRRLRKAPPKSAIKQEMELLDEQDPVPKSECFSAETECLSLIEDCHKAAIYEDVMRRLKSQWPAEEAITDRFFDVMANALRDELADQSRPTLTNELADFRNPYMMTRSALKRLLEVVCARNQLEESLVPEFLDRLPRLTKLRTQAPLPPEVLEPLMAFRGDVRYHFDNRERLAQKCDAVVAGLKRLDSEKADSLANVLSGLPENYPSEEIHPNHPFANHFGFKSAEPVGYCGWIRQGKPPRKSEEELRKLRYPTLQRVAHTLPKDAKYRSDVSHVIALLERSRGWKFEDKVKAVNVLKEVWNNMAPSSHYNRVLEDALPMIRKPGMVKFTRSRVREYCRGLKYIRSLTTQKPIAARKKK